MAGMLIVPPIFSLGNAKLIDFIAARLDRHSLCFHGALVAKSAAMI
jgi:hypothetical protein